MLCIETWNDHDGGGFQNRKTGLFYFSEWTKSLWIWKYEAEGMETENWDGVVNES